jgi:hypothetical protein
MHHLFTGYQYMQIHFTFIGNMWYLCKSIHLIICGYQNMYMIIHININIYMWLWYCNFKTCISQSCHIAKILYGSSTIFIFTWYFSYFSTFQWQYIHQCVYYISNIINSMVFQPITVPQPLRCTWAYFISYIT